MNILLWIVFGALAGWIASLVMGTDRQMGAVANIVLGVLGAIVGGFITTFLGLQGVTGFNIWSIVVAIVGAVVLIWLGRLLYR